MKEIGAFEAKTKLGQLLDWVEAGEEVVITRRGKAGATLVSPYARFDAERTRGVAARVQARRRGVERQGSDRRGPPSTLVIDASLILIWYFEVESTSATDGALPGGDVPSVSTWPLAPRGRKCAPDDRARPAHRCGQSRCLARRTWLHADHDRCRHQ
jgi:prevent-host-death family protein